MGSVLGFPDIDPKDAAIGLRLKRWREARGVSMNDLARALSISPEEGRRAEAGRAHLDSCQLNAAAMTLRLPVWALVSDSPAY